MHSSNGHKVALSSSSWCVTNLQGKSGSVNGQRKPQLSLHVSSHIPDEGPREVLSEARHLPRAGSSSAVSWFQPRLTSPPGWGPSSTHRLLWLLPASDLWPRLRLFPRAASALFPWGVSSSLLFTSFKMYVGSDRRILLRQPPSLTCLCPFPALGPLYRLSVPLLGVPFRFCQSAGCVLRTGDEALVPTFCLALVPVLHTSKGSPFLQPGMCSTQCAVYPLFPSCLPMSSQGVHPGSPCEKPPYSRCWLSEFPTLRCLGSASHTACAQPSAILTRRPPAGRQGVSI